MHYLMLHSEGIKLKNILVEFQTVLVEFQIVLVEIPILNQFKWGFQFVLVETPIGVSTRFKPVEIPIGNIAYDASRVFGGK